MRRPGIVGSLERSIPDSHESTYYPAVSLTAKVIRRSSIEYGAGRAGQRRASRLSGSFEYGRAFELMNGVWQPTEVWAAFIASSLAEHGP